MKRQGYILLELIIALTMFSLAVLGLASALSNSMEVANILNKDYAVRMAMRSFLEELRRKPLADMATTTTDANTGATLTSTITDVQLRSKEGRNFSDVKQLTIKADYNAAGKPRDESVSVLIYRSESEDQKRRNQ
jgi:type II secretory pathway pseudopilin PulG